MGLLGFALAGGLEGIGKGMVEKAKAEREERMKELEHQRQIARDEASRGFTAAENQKSRDHQSTEKELDRMQQSSENEANRAHQATEGDKNRENKREPVGEYRTDQHGNTHRIIGSKAEPVVGQDGKPVGGLRRSPKDDERLSPNRLSVAMENSDRALKQSIDDGMDPAEAIEHHRNLLVDTRGVPPGVADKWAEHQRAAKKIKPKEEAAKSGGLAPKGTKKYYSNSDLDVDTGGPVNPEPARPSTAAPTPSKDQARVPPPGYPDAKWSDKAGGWVIQKDGKWFKVT